MHYKAVELLYEEHKKEVELLKGQIKMWKEYEYKARMETLSLLDENISLKQEIHDLHNQIAMLHGAL